MAACQTWDVSHTGWSADPTLNWTLVPEGLAEGEQALQALPVGATSMLVRFDVLSTGTAGQRYAFNPQLWDINGFQGGITSLVQQFDDQVIVGGTVSFAFDVDPAAVFWIIVTRRTTAPPGGFIATDNTVVAHVEIFCDETGPEASGVGHTGGAFSVFASGGVPVVPTAGSRSYATLIGG